MFRDIVGCELQRQSNTYDTSRGVYTLLRVTRWRSVWFLFHNPIEIDWSRRHHWTTKTYVNRTYMNLLNEPITRFLTKYINWTQSQRNRQFTPIQHGWKSPIILLIYSSIMCICESCNALFMFQKFFIIYNTTAYIVTFCQI